MDIPEEVVIVPMDPILIRQVIVNIMENAVIHGGIDDAGEGNRICGMKQKLYFLLKITGKELMERFCRCYLQVDQPPGR